MNRGNNSTHISLLTFLLCRQSTPWGLPGDFVRDARRDCGGKIEIKVRSEYRIRWTPLPMFGFGAPAEDRNGYAAPREGVDKQSRWAGNYSKSGTVCGGLRW